MNVHPSTMLMGADNLPSGPGMQLANELEVVRKAGRQAISSFLDSHNCFSVLRASGKVVVFDTRIPIQLAFYALVEHGASDEMKMFPMKLVNTCSHYVRI
jgi:hypothetical protein